MRNYLIRRSLQMIPVFIVIVVSVFLLIHSAPGDPVTGTAYLVNGKGSSPYSGTCTTKYPATVSRLPCD